MALIGKASSGDLEPESEFEDTYDVDARAPLPREVFSAELLEETLEILRLGRPVCVLPDEWVQDVIQGMRERNHGCVLVTEDGVLSGIFTERDVVRRVAGLVDPRTTRVRSVMTRDPEAVSFHDTIAAALNKMTVGGFRHVPLVDIRRRPVGVVSVKDIVQYFVQHFPRHVLNVAPDPASRQPDEIRGAG